MALMEPPSFLQWWNISAKVTSDGSDASALAHGDEKLKILENPLLGTLDYPKKPKSFGKVAFSIVTLLAVTCFVLATLWSSSERVELKGKPVGHTDSPDTVTSKKGVVTCDDERCSKIGVMILNMGGHAVDAAIATALCLGVVSPTESGIGGGSFMIVRNASNANAVAINMREVAPAAATEDMYNDHPKTQESGALSVAVPGELAGLRKAWEMYGRLEWRTLFQPAIEYARYGFVIHDFLASDIQTFARNLTRDPGLRQVFAPDGALLEMGNIAYNKRLAETLEAVAELGPQAFYDGPISQKLIDDLNDAGGIITRDDLRNYKVNVSDVLEVDDVLGYKILGMPPPSSGTVGFAMIGNVLSRYEKNFELDDTLGLHRMIEATKHMFAIRSNLGDPAFVDVHKYISDMISQDYAETIKNLIVDNTTFPYEYYQSRWSSVRDGGTCHLSVVDAERNAVALTTSINDSFGSKFMSPTTGVLFNNQMRDFSTPKQNNSSPANYVKPGKRPLSTMSPLILLKDGQLAGVIGGTGGPFIVGAVFQVFYHHFIQKMSPHDAVHRTRVFAQLIDQDADVQYENRTCFSGEPLVISDKSMAFLKKSYHKMKELNYEPICHLITHSLEDSIDFGRKIGEKYSVYGNVTIGTLTAVGDPRKDSKPKAQRG